MIDADWDLSTREGRLRFLRDVQITAARAYLMANRVPFANQVATGTVDAFNQLGGRPFIEAGEFLLDSVAPTASKEQAVRKTTAKQKRRQKMMSKAMKQVRVRACKKNGQLKKGWTQSRIMREAHKECNRRMRK